MTNKQMQISAAAVTIIVIATAAGYGLGKSKAERELPVEVVEVAVQELPPVIIQVDNVDCVIAETPTLTYYVQTDTVRVNIECDSDILFNYLPATVGGDDD
jgi:hypothetical protein